MVLTNQTYNNQDQTQETQTTKLNTTKLIQFSCLLWHLARKCIASIVIKKPKLLESICFLEIAGVNFLQARYQCRRHKRCVRCARTPPPRSGKCVIFWEGNGRPIVVANDGIKKSAHCFQTITQLHTPSQKFLVTPLHLQCQCTEGNKNWPASRLMPEARNC